MEGVLKTMLLKKLTTVLLVMLVVLGVAGAGSGVLLRLATAAQQGGVEGAGKTAARTEPVAGDKKETGRPAAAPEAEERIQPGDRLRISVNNTLPAQPINGVYRVEPSGKVALGPAYGRVRVKGMTLEEAEAAIRDSLARLVKEPQVLVTCEDSPADERIQALERRVRRLEEEVRDLRATRGQPQKQ
jgi:hypothetical protein